MSTVAGLIAWATLCLCHIRFRRALHIQGISLNTLPWKAPLQPYAAWVGLIGSIIMIFITGFPVFLKGLWSSSDFIAAYIGIPIFILPILAWKFLHRSKVSIEYLTFLPRSIVNNGFSVCSLQIHRLVDWSPDST